MIKHPIEEEPTDNIVSIPENVVEATMVERLALEELKETLKARVERRIQKEIAKVIWQS